MAAARPYKNITMTYRQKQPPPTWRRNARETCCWRSGEPGHFGNNCVYGWKADNVRSLKYDERLIGDQATTEKRTGEVANNREKSEGRRRRARADVYIKAPHHALRVITENADPSLVTQGWVGDKQCLVTVDTSLWQDQI
jgi:hypothetical protein